MPTLTDDQLAAWKQLQWATALITSQFRRDLAAAGLSLEQFDVLVHLAWAPSGTLPLHELTASMVVADALSRSGITRLLDRMERDGLITRTVSTTDRRRFDVSLTTPGPPTPTGSAATSPSRWPPATSASSPGSWTA